MQAYILWSLDVCVCGGGAAALPVLESCDNVDVNSWANHPFKHPLFLATFTFSVPFFYFK